MQTPRIVKGNVAATVFATLTLALGVTVLGGASCSKEDKKPTADPGAVIAAADSAQKPLDRSPVPGVDVSRLPQDRQDLFYKLVADLPSPCGKAHSLRTSVTQDQSCRKAPFATKMVAELIVDEISADDIREFYDGRYVKTGDVRSFELGTAPMVGNPSAAVTFVEFFDYGCPACVQMKPLLDEVIAANEGRIRFVYKMYPLVDKHPDSLGCAQAALAAHAQGKFHEMHDLIFKKFGAQKPDQLRSYAEQIGLDLGKYDAALAGMEPQVRADMAEGQKSGVNSTPTVFLNGRHYEGPWAPKYLSMAIDEAIALKN